MGRAGCAAVKAAERENEEKEAVLVAVIDRRQAVRLVQGAHDSRCRLSLAEGPLGLELLVELSLGGVLEDEVDLVLR